MKKLSRRDFIKTMAAGTAALGLNGVAPHFSSELTGRLFASTSKNIVSIVKIKNDNIDYAVRNAIDLLGGIQSIAKDKKRILLKPNLVGPEPRDVTKPDVIEALAKLMLEAGKDVSIGEGSAAAGPNFRPTAFGKVCSTKDPEMLKDIQQLTFFKLGYSDLAKILKVPLVNLHVGEMSKVKLPHGFVYKEISLHHALTDTDLLCSVPMMKTHGLATVTLGMKNLIGVYPGQVYGTVRSAVHREAAKVEPSGTASAIVDMVQANKLGLVVVDASTAMQGQGPSVRRGGKLVKMNLIIAGTNPLATDMVTANIMGFEPREIPTFIWAWKAKMMPISLDQIEIRGEKIANVRQNFLRPHVYPWSYISGYGPPC
ncbi:DUF362 domain-containing protein [Thermodesulfobacteriota bacterium]